MEGALVQTLDISRMKVLGKRFFADFFTETIGRAIIIAVTGSG